MRAEPRNLATLIESALVAAFAITDGVDVWSRALIARESSVQDVAITPRTREVARGRSLPVHGYPVFTSDDAARAGAEVPGVLRHALMRNGPRPPSTSTSVRRRS